ncbi:hypothetical protein FRY74_07980 [Vicingus serpentipes]|uniref:Transporter n=1 Tax=Vicingus serpentipes TaxID=1926625 RepID=A0A5C6RSN7_9FLAO|nr:hypothetical protein [Vicingus serpentipes]TXB65351.1 hypothetical protein FRY74_07980 [Vicingus serpentipes]
MRYLFFIFSVLSFLFITSGVYSQGCSDAGVCSVGSLGLAQYKYEKLPFDKVKLEMIEAEDTEIFSKDFNPRKKSDTTEVVKQQEVLIVDTPVKQFKNEALTTYNIDSIKANSNFRRDFLSKSPRLILNNLLSYGVGDNQTSIITNNLEINYRLLNRKLYAQIKIPYIAVNGDLANTKGLGDLTLSLSYTAINKKKKNLSFVAGVKIPTNESNLSEDNDPLPMVYQTSLGSKDALIGFNYRYSKWDVTFAYQHSFNTTNNKYLHNPLKNDNYNSYFESNQLKRADDGVFRINRSFLFKKGTITSGLLFIYHLQNDTYVDAFGNRKTAEGSKGLTLNLNIAAIYPIVKKVDFTFIFARPLIIRDARPDGLTRDYIVMGGLRYSIP